jgi:hypothetical protein
MASSGKERAVSSTPTEIDASITATVVTAKDDALLLKKETVKV